MSYFYIGLIYSKHITFNLIIYSFYDADDSYYKLLVNEFNNEYTKKKKDLDISVQLTVLTPDDSSVIIENYGTMIESLFVKKSIKVYTFSLKTDETNTRLIIFIIFLIFITMLILSSTFLIIKKLENKFQFLSKDLWIITTLGSLILMSFLTTLYGDVTNAKCHLRIILINVGFVLSICLFLYKIIANFPKSNKLLLRFEKNKYNSILLIMILTMSLNGIFTMSSYNFKFSTTSEGKNYKKYIMNNIFGNFIYYLIQYYDILVILIINIIFMEWNLDVKYLAIALFMDILSLILLNIIEKIRFKDYIMKKIIKLFKI